METDDLYPIVGNIRNLAVTKAMLLLAENPTPGVQLGAIRSLVEMDSLNLKRLQLALEEERYQNSRRQGGLRFIPRSRIYEELEQRCRSLGYIDVGSKEPKKKARADKPPQPKSRPSRALPREDRPGDAKR